MTVPYVSGLVNGRSDTGARRFERGTHRAEARLDAAQRGAELRLCLRDAQAPVERARRLLPELGRGRWRQIGGVQVEDAADQERIGHAVQHVGAGQVPGAAQLPLATLHGGGGHVGVVAGARALVQRGAKALAGAAGADELVGGVLLLTLGAVHHAGAHHQRARERAQHRLLALPLALPIDAERARPGVLGIGPIHTVEDVVRGVVDEAGAGAGGRLRGGERPAQVRREGFVRMVLAVVHVAQRGGAQHPVGTRLADKALGRGRIGEVERHESGEGLVGPGADRLVAPRAQHAQQRRAHLSGSSDHQRAHELEPYRTVRHRATRRRSGGLAAPTARGYDPAGRTHPT